jgi:hypothetical protein
MSKEFHYSPGEWKYLKNQLDEHWVPLAKYLSDHRPYGIPDDVWDEFSFDDDDSPKAIFVWTDSETKERITTSNKVSGTHISARELFLEAMRPHIQGGITHHEQGGYIPANDLKTALKTCNKKFANLLESLANLPPPVRNELNSQLVTRLEETLRALIKPIPNYPKLGANFYRNIFLNEMHREYRAVYGDLPAHSRDQKFNAVAIELCTLADFSGGDVDIDSGKTKKVLSQRQE